MPDKDKVEKRKDAVSKRYYRFKYVTDDGQMRVVSHEIPYEIDINTRTSDLFKNIILWLVIASILFSIFSFFERNDGSVSADALKDKIILAVENGADLEVVRRIYETRKPIKSGFLSIFGADVNEYPIDVPLSAVLEDIRADLYLGDNKLRDGTVSKINTLIDSHNQKNPFDKLTKTQKEYFENVRQKIGESYTLVQSDMNNISDELYSQNQLVETYLSDSRTSLYVSIFSLLFALIISSYQIYQGRPGKIAENLKVLLEGIFTESNKESEDLSSQASGTPKDGDPF